MAFEKKVANQWNQKFGSKKKKKVAKPRIDVEAIINDEPEQIEEKETAIPSF
ncbi:hypothetical protein QO179_24115 [Bacillus stercoris]|nr:hypothetical protein [Bacillus stercoris]